MVCFTTLIERFTNKGEKTGWTYIHLPAETANEIKPGCRISFRVKGFLDETPVSGIALIPMGEGDFILALKADLRKKLHKKVGQPLSARLEEHVDFKIEMPADLEECLNDLPELMAIFLKQPPSHQNYYFNWINSAKTEPTRAKRIAMTVNAMEHQWDFGEMIRKEKTKESF